MCKYISVNKNGDVEEKQTRQPITSEKIYKLCNYKNSTGFEMLHNYPLQSSENNDDINSIICYEVYGKRQGRANNENKYELPPPIDTELFFGNLCILKKENDTFVDLTFDEWSNVYESMFGGFEDIEHSDEERSMDSEIYSSDDYTKEGYHKDSFIVEDGELEEEEYE